MSAIYTHEVKIVLNTYESKLRKKGGRLGLNKYHVSKERKKSKLSKLKAYLQGMGKKNPESYPVCDKLDLGQVFKDGEPLLQYLKQDMYQDETTGKTWSFSFIKISPNRVRIYRIKPPYGVEESELLSYRSLTNIEIIKKMIAFDFD